MQQLNWYCRNLDHTHVTNELRAVGKKFSYWTPSEIITISFIGGTVVQRDMVISTIAENTKFINLDFQYITSGGMIRIAFKNDGAWSNVGKDCLGVPLGQATMNLGWLDKSVILHEFGHSLGLYHEHQNPNQPIQWNMEEVIKDLSGQPNNWDLATIQFNVLDKYEMGEVDSTPLDIKSIMLYPIPVNWTLNGFHTEENTDFSEVDKLFLTQRYPFEPVINPYVDMLRKIFLKSYELEHLTEGELVRMGGLIGCNTAARLTKVQNLKLVKDKLFV